MSKSILYKYFDGKWAIDPPNSIAYSGEVIYTKGDENIEASAAEDACRLVLFFDRKNEKAAIAHIHLMNTEQYKDLINPIRTKKFDTTTTMVYLCGDETTYEYQSWNDEIESYVVKMGFTVKRIVSGNGKDVIVNPGADELVIKDSNNRLLI